MHQADIEIAVRSSLLAYFSNVPVLQHYDYLKKGRKTTAIYFGFNDPTKIGNPYRKYNVVDDNSNHEELQHYEATINLVVLKDEDSTDFAMTVQQVVSSLPFIEMMRKKGLGVNSVSEVKTLHIQDESDNYITQNNISFNITYNRILKPNTKATKDGFLNLIKGV